ncbi:alpha/beta fold hydrolase [Streptomyces sp. DSM 44915]|uniref:Alpha/beta fold hydrolase n=1 Tax=Streptomyces chisholmiae TaxID=3075540 RepID=A0ABU2JIX6_9ACTN|nr:alpha/beta fold hydrolase [Streptomyces sp. DSM 44915]MDT0264940.1 alpha/beta fold hydrolase [Streptomyces sp. DSM 44915]
MRLLPGAEPFYHRPAGEAQVGVLLCHGFTSTPQSLRPWAEALAASGHHVSLPLLPGHGTRWQELAVTGWRDWYAVLHRELLRLTERCARVVVCGLSMGGSLALRLAARQPASVSALALVNPALTFPAAKGVALRALRHVVPSAPGLIGDIASPGSREVGYDRVPLPAADSLRELFSLVRADLPQVTQPLLLMRSTVDHVVPPSDSTLLATSVSSVEVREVPLTESFHVATLDHDAGRIFQETDAFITRLVTRKTARDGT